jgi:inorganic triphosphatase YgiF
MYTLMNDDMDRIDTKYGMSMEEIMEEATQKKVEQQQRVEDQLSTLQHMLEAVSITKERNMRKDHP